MKWELKEIEPGDMVRVPMGEMYHYGICTSEDRIVEFGRPVLTNPVPREEIRVGAVTIEEFLGGSFAEAAVFDRRELKRRRDTAEIIRHAEESVGRGGYDILYNNCEHFAHECVFGTHRSSQVDDVRAEIERKMPCINVYIAEVSRFQDNDILPAYAKKELKKITSEKAAAEKRAGCGLLRYAADRMDKKPDVRKCSLSKTGKPVHKGFCFSVSHSGGLVAAAVSSADVGIDIEEESCHAKCERFGQMILHENEKASDSDMLLLWTKKEAVFKQRGDEAHFRPQETDTTGANTKSFRFCFSGKDYILTIAADVLVNLHINSLLPDEAQFDSI